MRGTLPPLLRGLPPLLAMERLLFRIIAAGFVLLTLTLASGMLFSEELFGKPLQLTHKMVFGIAAVDHLRRPAARARALGLARAHRACAGRSPASSSLVLAYIGSKFVLEVILHR